MWILLLALLLASPSWGQTWDSGIDATNHQVDTTTSYEFSYTGPLVSDALDLQACIGVTTGHTNPGGVVQYGCDTTDTDLSLCTPQASLWTNGKKFPHPYMRIKATAGPSSGTAVVDVLCVTRASASVSAGSGHTIQDEGSGLTARSNLNFTGAGVECTDDAGSDATDCDISASGFTPDDDPGVDHADYAGDLALLAPLDSPVFTTSLTIPGAAAPAPTTDGDCRWDTDDDLLKCGDGSVAVTIGPTTGAAGTVNEDEWCRGGTGGTLDCDETTLPDGDIAASITRDTESTLVCEPISEVSPASTTYQFHQYPYNIVIDQIYECLIDPADGTDTLTLTLTECDDDGDTCSGPVTSVGCTNTGGSTASSLGVTIQAGNALQVAFGACGGGGSCDSVSWNLCHYRQVVQ